METLSKTHTQRKARGALKGLASAEDPLREAYAQCMLLFLQEHEDANASPELFNDVDAHGLHHDDARQAIRDLAAHGLIRFHPRPWGADIEIVSEAAWQPKD